MTQRRLPMLLAASVVATGIASAVPARSEGPPLRHVFTIVLENSEFEQTFVAGRTSAPYLTQTLPSQGTLVVNYYGTGHSSLDNYIAMTSGQGPNDKTKSDCNEPSVLGGTAGVRFDGDGQAIGSPGCTYPSSVHSISDQLDAAGVSWKGYMQGMGGPCSTAGVSLPGATGAYRNKHNPWSYYHATFDQSASCAAHVVPLEQLTTDLGSVRTTPHYSFITPDQCNDGHDSCGSNNQLQGADAFLQTWVPRITSSPAFRKDGLLVIVFDEGSTNLFCCGEKKAPNLGANDDNGYPSTAPLPEPPGPVADGGGKTGAILIGPGVAANKVDVLDSFNHYSYLRSMEDLFRLRRGGTDGRGHLGYAADGGLRTFQDAGLVAALPGGGDDGDDEGGDD